MVFAQSVQRKSCDEYRLATFPTLFGQMRSAVNEASAIAEEAGIRTGRCASSAYYPALGRGTPRNKIDRLGCRRILVN